MGRKLARRFTAGEKLRILEEARQPKTTVAEGLRRHGSDANQSPAHRRGLVAFRLRLRERERERAPGVRARS